MYPSSKPSHSSNTNVQDTIKGSQQNKMVFPILIISIQILETFPIIIKTAFRQCIGRTKS